MAAEIVVRVAIPALKVNKCITVVPSEKILVAKNKLLDKEDVALENSTNYSLYLPNRGSSPGSFLDEERTLQDYCLHGDVPTLEFRPICRDYGGTSGLTEKKVVRANSPACLKRFVEHVRRAEVRKMEKMLAEGLDPNFITEDGNTPLGQACARGGKPTLILTLLNGGANFTFRGRDGLTALHRSAIGGNNDAIDTLMNQGASPNYKDSKGLTPLFHTIIMGDVIPCHNLLMCYSEVDVADGNAYTELHQAAKHGHCRQIELLLQYGASLHSVNTLGNTPLHVAASQGQLEAVGVLLRRGARRDIPNNMGNPPNQVAIICGHHQAASIIVNFTDEGIETLAEKPSYHYKTSFRPANWAESSQGAELASSVVQSLMEEQLTRNAEVPPERGRVNSIPALPRPPHHGNRRMTEGDIKQSTGSQGERTPSPTLPGRHGNTPTRTPSGSTMKKFLVTEDYVPVRAGELPVKKGMTVQVIQTRHDGLCQVQSGGRVGWLHMRILKEVPPSLSTPRATSPAPAPAPLDTPPATPPPGEERQVTVSFSNKGYGFAMRGVKGSALALKSFKPTNQIPSLQYVAKVDPESSAEQAGLVVGDFLLEVNGLNVVVATHDEVVDIVRQARGNPLEMKVMFSSVHSTVKRDSASREGKSLAIDTPPLSRYGNSPNAPRQRVMSHSGPSGIPSEGQRRRLMSDSSTSSRDSASRRTPPPVPEQETSRQETSRQETPRRETSRQETSRQDTPRLELYRQEPSRQESSRQEVFASVTTGAISRGESSTSLHSNSSSHSSFSLRGNPSGGSRPSTPQQEHRAIPSSDQEPKLLPPGDHQEPKLLPPGDPEESSRVSDSEEPLSPFAEALKEAVRRRSQRHIEVDQDQVSSVAPSNTSPDPPGNPPPPDTQTSFQVELLKRKLEQPTTLPVSSKSDSESEEEVGSGNPVTSPTVASNRESADILTKLMAAIGQSPPPHQQLPQQTTPPAPETTPPQPLTMHPRLLTTPTKATPTKIPPPTKPKPKVSKSDLTDGKFPTPSAEAGLRDNSTMLATMADHHGNTSKPPPAVDDCHDNDSSRVSLGTDNNGQFDISRILKSSAVPKQQQVKVPVAMATEPRPSLLESEGAGSMRWEEWAGSVNTDHPGRGVADGGGALEEGEAQRQVTFDCNVVMETWGDVPINTEVPSSPQEGTPPMVPDDDNITWGLSLDMLPPPLPHDASCDDIASYLDNLIPPPDDCLDNIIIPPPDVSLDNLIIPPPDVSLDNLIIPPPDVSLDNIIIPPPPDLQLQGVTTGESTTDLIAQLPPPVNEGDFPMDAFLEALTLPPPPVIEEAPVWPLVVTPPPEKVSMTLPALPPLEEGVVLTPLPLPPGRLSTSFSSDRVSIIIDAPENFRTATAAGNFPSSEGDPLEGGDIPPPPPASAPPTHLTADDDDVSSFLSPPLIHMVHPEDHAHKMAEDDVFVSSGSGGKDEGRYSSTPPSMRAPFSRYSVALETAPNISLGDSQGSTVSESYQTRPLKAWSTEDVCEWLRDVGLEEHVQTFAENEIMGEHLVDMTKDDLRELGMRKIGHRKTFLSKVQHLHRIQSF